MNGTTTSRPRLHAGGPLILAAILLLVGAMLMSLLPGSSPDTRHGRRAMEPETARAGMPAPVDGVPGHAVGP